MVQTSEMRSSDANNGFQLFTTSRPGRLEMIGADEARQATQRQREQEWAESIGMDTTRLLAGSGTYTITGSRPHTGMLDDIVGDGA